MRKNCLSSIDYTKYRYYIVDFLKIFQLISLGMTYVDKVLRHECLCYRLRLGPVPMHARRLEHGSEPWSPHPPPRVAARNSHMHRTVSETVLQQTYWMHS